MIIDLPRFVAAERPSWTEFETSLKRIESNPNRSLSLDEAKRFHFLYQKVSADLARIATFSSEPELRRYLESLVAQAYGEIHETRRRGQKWRLVSWFFVDFPRVFRRQSWAFVLATAVTVVGAVFGAFAVGLDDDAKEAIVPAQFAHLLGNPADRVAREEKAKSDRFSGEHATFAGSLMTNNIRVAINAMALGMTWGLGTILVLFFNGVTVGLVAIDYIRANQTLFLFGWLMPHGVIEIPATLIAGQAGFVLGKAIIGRGDRATLAERLRDVGGDVATLTGGVAIMLVWAGIVESFLSQYHQPVIPYWLKIAFGTVELVLLVIFLGYAGATMPHSSKSVNEQTAPSTP
jgi:uncharacterized membrane protein SpoIIM required for sporulation